MEPYKRILSQRLGEHICAMRRAQAQSLKCGLFEVNVYLGQPSYECASFSDGFWDDFRRAYLMIDSLEGEPCIGAQTDRLYHLVHAGAKASCVERVGVKNIRVMAAVNRMEALMDWSGKCMFLADLPGYAAMEVLGGLERLEPGLELRCADDFKFRCQDDDLIAKFDSRVSEYHLLLRGSFFRLSELGPALLTDICR